MKMDIQPKSGDGGLRGVKTKSSHQSTRQQHKFRNTLEQWLIKPRKKQSTAEVCQTQDSVEMTGDGSFQSSSALSLDSQNGEKLTVSDMDEETQPLTPQNLEEDSAMSSASKDSTRSDIQTASHKDDGLEEQEKETFTANSENSIKHNKKITDFFPGTSSPDLPVRRAQSHKSSEKHHADKETTSADVKPEVKWLGTPISELKRMPACGRAFPPLKNIPGQHTVMIRV